VARALERSLAEQSLVLEALPLALFTAAADAPGARQFIGGNLQALSGREGDAAEAGESWLAHVHPDDRPRLESALPGLTAARTYDIEYRLGHG
ncbi:MAG TPA: PAS domain-containing protein, partial [Paracoccus sp. (in: a-proteobacteria)]|nr:PAS domain-containing protein [Paracoccus sp. (in: a-proteobacteria)]